MVMVITIKIDVENVGVIVVVTKEEIHIKRRIMIKDTPGNLGKVTSILGKFRINIDKVIQNNKALKSKTIPVIILTKSLELKTLNKALKDITKKKLIQKESLIIPVEDLA